MSQFKNQRVRLIMAFTTYLYISPENRRHVAGYLIRGLKSITSRCPGVCICFNNRTGNFEIVATSLQMTEKPKLMLHSLLEAYKRSCGRKSYQHQFNLDSPPQKLGNRRLRRFVTLEKCNFQDKNTVGDLSREEKSHLEGQFAQVGRSLGNGLYLKFAHRGDLCLLAKDNETINQAVIRLLSSLVSFRTRTTPVDWGDSDEHS